MAAAAPAGGRTYLAGLAGPLRGTDALEAVDQVDAGAALGAGGGRTFVGVWKTNGSVSDIMASGGGAEERRRSHLWRRWARTSPADSGTQSRTGLRDTSPRWRRDWRRRRVRLKGGDRIRVWARYKVLVLVLVGKVTDLAVLAGVAVRTGAVVLVRLRVHARAPVPAGPVGSAVVEICRGQRSDWFGTFGFRKTSRLKIHQRPLEGDVTFTERGNSARPAH